MAHAATMGVATEQHEMAQVESSLANSSREMARTLDERIIMVALPAAIIPGAVPPLSPRPAASTARATWLRASAMEAEAEMARAYGAASGCRRKVVFSCWQRVPRERSVSSMCATTVASDSPCRVV